MYKCISLAVVLLMVITTTIIIVIGCGGNDNTVSPNIYTPTPATEKMAYITVRVTWPSRGEEGKFIISSGDDNGETHRMPDDAKRIEIKIKEVSSDEVIAEGGIVEPNTIMTLGIPVHVHVDNDPNTPTVFPSPADPNDANNPTLLPPIKVKITARVYDSAEGGNLISEIPPYEQIIYHHTDNPITINLGKYKIEANETKVYKCAPVKLSSKLTITDPTDPNNTPLNPNPIVGKNVQFTISEPNDANAVLDGNSILVGVTDANGVASVWYMYIDENNTNLGKKVQVNVYFLKSQNKTRSIDPNDVICSDSYITEIVDSYVLTVSANPATIFLSSNKNVEADNKRNWLELAKYAQVTPPLYTSTPRPTNTPGTPPTATPTSTPQTTSIITANLKLVIPDDTSGTGTLEPTKTPRPISEKKVTFTIVSGPGTLSSSTGLTDNNGNCSVSFSSDVEGKTIIEAVFQAVDGDPNSTYKSQCEVTTISQPSKYELHSYIWERPNYFVRVPDFKSPYIEPIKELTIHSYLAHVSQYDHSSMEGKIFRFTILSGNATLSSYSGTTPDTGVYNIKISTDDEPGPRTIEYKVECDTGEDGVSPLVVTNTVFVKDGLTFSDDFESYPVGTTIDKLKWSYKKLSDDLIAKNCITGEGISGKCVKLYSPPCYWDHEIIDVGLVGGGSLSYEIRCFIKNGTENTFEIPHMPWNGYFVRGYVNNIEYRYDKNEIYSGWDFSGTYLGTYGHGWESVRIQKVRLPGGFNAIKYYSPGNGLEIRSKSNIDKSRAGGVGIGSKGGTVWFDEVKYYSFDEGYVKKGTTPTPYSY